MSEHERAAGRPGIQDTEGNVVWPSLLLMLPRGMRKEKGEGGQWQACCVN